MKSLHCDSFMICAWYQESKSEFRSIDNKKRDVFRVGHFFQGVEDGFQFRDRQKGKEDTGVGVGQDDSHQTPDSDQDVAAARPQAQIVMITWDACYNRGSPFWIKMALKQSFNDKISEWWTHPDWWCGIIETRRCAANWKNWWLNAECGYRPGRFHFPSAACSDDKTRSEMTKQGQEWRYWLQDKSKPGDDDGLWIEKMNEYSMRYWYYWLNYKKQTIIWIF